MLRFIQSIRRYAASSKGLSTLELVISVGIMSIAMASTSGLFLAGRNFMRDQALDVETTQAARATMDLLLRELRLGGACLPITGDFISLDGTNVSDRDTIISRTGLTRPDLSCIKTTSTAALTSGATVITVDNIGGFAIGRRGYIRNTTGTGEFFDIINMNTPAKTLTIVPGVTTAYPSGSGVYEVDERAFRINNSDPTKPVLEMQIDSKPASKLAAGIERLNIEYQLQRNCPACDVVSLPANEPEWAIVEQVFLEVTARSSRLGPNGQYYRRTLRVGVKPRNLLPRG